jgi:hypothetical protein
MASNNDLRDSVDRVRDSLRRSAEREAFEPIRPPQETHVTEAPAPRTGLHPFFRGLLDVLPEPGEEWPAPQREQWLETARNIFTLIYADPTPERRPIPLAEHVRVDRPDSALGQRAV